MNKLYVRIWLAVVLAVAVLTLLVGWAWRMAAEAPLREVVVRNQAGEVIGQGQARFGRSPFLGQGLRMKRDTPQPPPMEASTDEADARPPLDQSPAGGPVRAGPEFEVRMHNGQTLHMHLPRSAQSSWRAPFGFFWTLGLVAVAVALATYPIIRRLTRRLEALQHSVEQWGDGKLSTRAHESGDDEVGFLASRFNRAAQQIETLVHSRDALLASQKSLLANASHELRSPLARIRMGLELMGSYSPLRSSLALTPGPVDSQPTLPPGGAELARGGPSLRSFQHARDEITRNISELDQLIEEILLASRLDAQEADLGTVESMDLVGLAAEECALTQASLNVPSGKTELVVPGVSKLLRRAVRNLLENARRYGAGEVTVHLTQEGALAIIRVCDRGPGVPEALQARIFEPFYRLPGASEREGGVGLGLALVKSITLRHGGTVRCYNRADGGACFEIRLPLSSDSAP